MLHVQEIFSIFSSVTEGSVDEGLTAMPADTDNGSMLLFCCIILM